MPVANQNPSILTTIGYEGVGIGDVLHVLKDAQVDCLIDVRQLPLSRRAGFSKRQLAAGLEECGISYRHLRGLGTPKPGRIAAKAGRMVEFRDIFDAHMKTVEAQHDLDLARQLVTTKRCCLLCFEAEPDCCHRSVVASALTDMTGLPVRHLRVV